MPVTVLNAAAHRRMPWKNGGGETVEIAVFPQGASVEDFDWRISMAGVAQDGPFSVFPGVDRTLSVLEGDGIVLDVAGESVRLTRQAAPYSFPADVPSGAVLIGGAITDLNVMTRRGRYAHTVRRMIVEGDAAGAVEADTMFVICTEGSARLHLGAETVELGPHDCALLTGENGVGFAIRGQGVVHCVSLTAVPASAPPLSLPENGTKRRFSLFRV